MSNMYDHHSIPHAAYHHPHHHSGHPAHHLRHPPHPHHMHHLHHHPIPARPPLANKVSNSNIQPYEPQPPQWSKLHVPSAVMKPLLPPLPSRQTNVEHPVQALALPSSQPNNETSTPQLSKTQRQQSVAKRQVKTPITLCFERMLGAGRCPQKQTTMDQ
jgi:hypothetical protein